jgi:hypothetical protein
VSASDEVVVLSIPATDYELHLSFNVDSAAVRPGRARGTIHARALRMHRATAGGRFIEPIQGTPRIVQGAVRRVDGSRGRVLIDAAVPMWVSPPPAQDLDDLKPGELVNFYVESGAAFVPEA